MKWSVFWKQFSSAVHNNDQLDNTQKLTYLMEAWKRLPTEGSSIAFPSYSNIRSIQGAGYPSQGTLRLEATYTTDTRDVYDR